MADPRWLTDDEQRAWRGYRRMRQVLDAAIARDLARDSGLSDSDYDVLSTLTEAPGNRWRLHELAARLTWSKSRLSHHASRMQARGLVTREGCADDARGAVVRLTPLGLRTLRRAAPLHVESVRRHLIDALAPDEQRALAELAERVVDRAGGAPGDPGAAKAADVTAEATDAGGAGRRPGTRRPPPARTG